MLRLFVLIPYAALVALFAGGFLARYVRPRRAWGLQIAAVGLPYTALVLVALTAVVLPLASGALAGVHLGLLVLIAVRFVPWRRFVRRKRSVPASALTVMTFNAHTRRRTPRRHPLFDLLRRERPDVIALQEPVLANLLPLARRYPASDPPFFPEPMRRHYDLPLPFDWLIPDPIVTRLDVLELRLLPFAEEGVATRARVRWDGREVAVYDVHLRSFTVSRPWRRRGGPPVAWREQFRHLRDDVRLRADQAEGLRALLDAETLPYLVCGDLNTTPHEWAYRRLASGLRDAFTYAGRGWGATYHARRPLFRIDYVFASPEWRIHTTHVPAFVLSDHRPVVVRLSL
ncbi:endonuclease/exonuclease/phosphatase family protein [Rhodocaloribacter sp.]